MLHEYIIAHLHVHGSGHGQGYGHGHRHGTDTDVDMAVDMAMDTDADVDTDMDTDMDTNTGMDIHVRKVVLHTIATKYFPWIPFYVSSTGISYGILCSTHFSRNSAVFCGIPRYSAELRGFFRNSAKLKINSDKIPTSAVLQKFHFVQKGENNKPFL
jgi:hypothetical protein